MAFGIAMDLETWNKLQLRILEARRRDFEAGQESAFGTYEGVEFEPETFADYLRWREKD